MEIESKDTAIDEPTKEYDGANTRVAELSSEIHDAKQAYEQFTNF